MENINNIIKKFEKLDTENKQFAEEARDAYLTAKDEIERKERRREETVRKIDDQLSEIEKALADADASLQEALIIDNAAVLNDVRADMEELRGIKNSLLHERGVLSGAVFKLSPETYADVKEVFDAFAQSTAKLNRFKTENREAINAEIERLNAMLDDWNTWGRFGNSGRTLPDYQLRFVTEHAPAAEKTALNTDETA